jgi:hypothetical protein
VNQEAVAHVREVIKAGDYVQALSLWNCYTSQLQDLIQRGQASASDLAEAGELVAWSWPVLRGARAQLHEQFGMVHTAAAYLDPCARTSTRPIVRSTWG